MKGGGRVESDLVDLNGKEDDLGDLISIICRLPRVAGSSQEGMEEL